MGFENEDYMKKEIEQSVMINEGYEKLKEIKGFWSGSDIKMEKEEIVPPNSCLETNLIINKDNFPSIDLDWGVFRCLNSSTRSRLAQAGIEIKFDQNSLSFEDFKQIKNGEDVNASVTVYNNGLRPIEIDGDVVRFFWVNEEDRLRGAELREAIFSGEIKMEGEEGEDWFMGDIDYDLDEKDSDLMKLNMQNEEFAKNSKDVMIVFPTDENKKMYIPQSDKPLKINNRADLENVLETVPDNLDNLNFEVGETSKIHLSNNICGVINTGMYNKGKHLVSPLIDPDFEGSIRSELTQGLNYFEVFIYKK
ncbi:MAG: hypothetical protein KAQ64_01115 [Candidatus Pacebacteria bacterium]|nr:hypothetical protein [Candidatus Paceibacterota bacterium]